MDQDAHILIVGYGSIGKRHFNNLISLGYNNISFLRTRKGALDDNVISKNKIFYDIESALKEKPTLVFITNPTSFHMETALKIADAGCNFFIEKPVSDTLIHCDQLLKQVKKKKLITMVGFQFRFHPLLIELKKMIESDDLGSVYNVTASYGEYLPDWHPWEDYRNSYSARDDLGGGVILTLTHPMDYLYWLFGDVNSINSVYSKADSIQTKVEDDIADIILYFNSGLIGHIHLDYIQRPASHYLKVFGDAASVKIDFIKGRMNHTFIDGKTKINEVDQSFNRNKMYLDELKHLMKSIRRNKQTNIPLKSGIDVLKFSLDAKQNVIR